MMADSRRLLIFSVPGSRAALSAVASVALRLGSSPKSEKHVAQGRLQQSHRRWLCSECHGCFVLSVDGGLISGVLNDCQLRVKSFTHQRLEGSTSCTARRMLRRLLR
ncbi:hypothetical protein EJ06DRAFT_303249 [Trichodelitschia bisporula]|uniref:Uncharacterized protein n=1 Tax=Trichodelitschia bisporula TaxID=703511 RepID=A0A6G1I7I5_9PEZI|nr:hypothetical protein EJ06DRAFT_303249 [Trichodelitschia bisporula]